MQDRYVGDIGDFGKYALLKSLAGADLRLAVVWYLYPDVEANGDGGFVAYPELRCCDPELHDTLATLVANGNRSVAAVECSPVLPASTIFYSRPLSFRDSPPNSRAARLTQRRKWLEAALNATSGADIVFMDPDNGFGGRSASPTSRTGPKYVFPDEVEQFLQRGQSVIVYHHQTRERGGLAVQVASHVGALRTVAADVPPYAAVFRRRSVRVYFIIPAPGHRDLLLERTQGFIRGPWGRDGHFELWEAE
jgi:hypothetical protein